MARIRPAIGKQPRIRAGYWFAAKRYGIGATPVTWPGWALSLAFAAALIIDVRTATGEIAKMVVGAVLLFSFAYVAWLKTDGGWHWHWGPDE
ncbi:MAG: hypothetical protein K2P68_11575 [Sphingomonas sp.]|nr:hypothetical protein [Sphingomonas sp.]